MNERLGSGLDTRDRLIVALDFSYLRDALDMVEALAGVVTHFKVGMELFYSEGPRAVEEVRRRGVQVFLDLKFHDIPNTVAQAARAVTGLGVSMFNLHVAGGLAMLQRAVAATGEEAVRRGVKRPLLLGMTLLTSIDERVLQEEMGVLGRQPLEQVLFWAELARRAGLDGVVASAQEVEAVKANLGEDFVVVTPGIRPRPRPYPNGEASGTVERDMITSLSGPDREVLDGAGKLRNSDAWIKDDQKRIVTPALAMAGGSDFLVVGRPITRAADPPEAARSILAEMQEGSPRSRLRRLRKG